MRYIMVLAAACVLLLPARSPGQRSYPRQRTAPSARTTNPGPLGGPLVTFQGTLKSLTSKEIVIDMETEEGVVFRRSRKTKFFRDEKAIKPSEIAVGMPLMIDATRDPDLKMAAINVIIGGRPTDAGGSPAQEASPVQAAEPLPAQPAPPAPAAPAPAIPAPPALPAPPPAIPRDAFLERVRPTVESALAALPAYTCQEEMSRFAGASQSASWKALGASTAEVTYRDAHFSYRNPRKELAALWPTGEFGAILRDLFGSAPSATLRTRQESDSGSAAVYDFAVEQPRSHWLVQADSESIQPGYEGSIWIDRASARILRIEMHASTLPDKFPLESAESAVDFQLVPLGEAQYSLPVHADITNCRRDDSGCSRMSIDFRNYRRAN